MYRFIPLEPTHAEAIVKWNENKSSDFLTQWSGRGFTYPITKEQVITDAANVSSSVFSILFDNRLIGTIALMSVDELSGAGHIGHFLLNPSDMGRGHGTASMHEFILLCFGVLKLRELSLRVFEHNTAAVRCYEKNGFTELNRTTTSDGSIVILMRLKNSKLTSTSDTPIEICAISDKDWYDAELLTQRAFWNLHVPGCNENLLIAKLRESSDYIASLSKIAIMNGRIVGVILYSKAYVIDSFGNKHDVLTFGPLSVEPNYQSMRIGGTLLCVTMDEAKKAGYPAIIIYGEPGYYPRFGFQTCDRFGITTPDCKNFDAFMGIELQSGALDSVKGRFYEPDVFEDISAEEADAYHQNFPPLVKIHLPGHWV